MGHASSRRRRRCESGASRAGHRLRRRDLDLASRRPPTPTYDFGYDFDCDIGIQAGSTLMRRGLVASLPPETGHAKHGCRRELWFGRPTRRSSCPQGANRLRSVSPPLRRTDDIRLRPWAYERRFTPSASGASFLRHWKQVMRSAGGAMGFGLGALLHRSSRPSRARVDFVSGSSFRPPCLLTMPSC